MKYTYNEKLKGEEVLLIGYGSMGKRHAVNLIKLGLNPYILTNHPDNLNAKFLNDISEVANQNITHCIISSPTARHLDDLKKSLKGINGLKKILIEKPLECSLAKSNEIKTQAEEHNLKVFVAYNLRFLDAFDKIKKFIEEQKNSIKIVEVVAGQNLEEWRPGTDYMMSYSASREQGGGVDLDLSHEIDYVLWLFGNDFKDQTIYRSKISNLTINSPDVFKLILDYSKFVVDITLDYIRRPKERYLKVICENGENLHYDFVNGTLKINNRTTMSKDAIEQTYIRMLKALFGIDKGQENRLCTLGEGINILKVLGV